MADPVTCVDAVLSALGAHLKANMPSLQQVLLDFPDAGTVLKMPSLTIFSGASPAFMPLDPYPLEQGDTVNHRALVKRVVGEYDLNLQLDLWCPNKLTRSKLWEEFFKAFNPEVSPMGLSLQLMDYHEIWCRYDLTGYDLGDSEESSQSGQWRARINVLANTRAVIEKTEFVIETIENTLETPDNIDA